MLLTEVRPDTPRKQAVDVGKHLAMQKGVKRFPSAAVELYLRPGFLSAEDCQRIINLIEGAWKPSSIADDNGIAGYRTSETRILDSTHPLLASLEERIAALTGLDPLHGERLQAQKYSPGQAFKEHTDYFEPDGSDYERCCSQTGQRTWTVMIYLNEPEAGGFTHFKRIGATVKPAAGTLLAWNNLDRSGQPNVDTLHQGMPVEKGTKYIITKWFRQRRYGWSEEVVERLSSGLRFDGRPPRIVRPAPEPPAVVPASPAQVDGIDPVLALKRRDWMLSVMQELRTLRDPQIPRSRGLTSEAFLREHYALNRPVIIEGEMEDWPALTLWNPIYLKRRIGSVPVEFQGSRNSNERFEMESDHHKVTLPFNDFMDSIAYTYGNDVYITANNSATNSAAFEVLASDVRPLSNYLTGKPGMIWVGPMGTYTPIHHDLTNNMVAQVVGSKRVVLMPPSETSKLYNYLHVYSAVHDIMDEEKLDLYPLARGATTYEVDLNAGELLFIPIGWWHQVTALDFSITYTFTDFKWNNGFFQSFPRI